MVRACANNTEQPTSYTIFRVPCLLVRKRVLRLNAVSEARNRGRFRGWNTNLLREEHPWSEKLTSALTWRRRIFKETTNRTSWFLAIRIGLITIITNSDLWMYWSNSNFRSVIDLKWTCSPRFGSDNLTRLRGLWQDQEEVIAYNSYHWLLFFHHDHIITGKKGKWKLYKSLWEEPTFILFLIPCVHFLSHLSSNQPRQPMNHLGNWWRQLVNNN